MNYILATTDFALLVMSVNSICLAKEAFIPRILLTDITSLIIVLTKDTFCDTNEAICHVQRDHIGQVDC